MDGENPPPAETREVVLEARNITKRFPGVIANDDVNIKLHRGEILALLGENGAGKSTLMNIIYGLYHQDEGQIFLKGQEVRFTSPREAIYNRIGMVHQHFQLVDVMTVAENVVLGEEKERPLWHTLFSMVFVIFFGLAFTSLIVSYNGPLVYETFGFALLAILLPWIGARWLLTAAGFTISLASALIFAITAIPDAIEPIPEIIDPNIGLIPAIGIFLTALGFAYGVRLRLPQVFFDLLRRRLGLITLTLITAALLILLTLATEVESPATAAFLYSASILTAINYGLPSYEYEILVAIFGMVIIAGMGYAIPAIISANPFARSIRQVLSTRIRTPLPDVIIDFVALLLVAATALITVALGWLALNTILPTDSEIDEMVEFLALIQVALGIVGSVALGLAYALGAIFDRWQRIVAGMRLVWGLAWRLGLIGIALWLAGLAGQISQMMIITSLLQTDVPYVIEADNAGASGEYELEVSWRNIEQQGNTNEQIDALLAEIDETFYRQETFENTNGNYTGQTYVDGYFGIDAAWRDAVDDVPPIVEDVVAAVLLILFALLAIGTWRGTSVFPEVPQQHDLALMAIIAGLYVAAIPLTSAGELGTVPLVILTLVGAAVMAGAALRTIAERRNNPDRIRPITPVDTFIDALADFLYTLTSVRNTRAAAERVGNLSRQYGLEVDPDAMLEKLPVGLQQRVEIVKALYREADILILDEPTAVLTPQEGRELFKIMRELAAQGVSIIFITHKLKEVFEVATNIVVMRGGKVVGTTTPQDATEASLAAMMVGREVLLRVEKTDAQPDGRVLHVESLHAYNDRGAKALNGVAFNVHAGEVLGVAGVQGNGQSELVEVLTGLRPMEEGAVELLGQELKPKRHPDATPLRRFWAVTLDALLVGFMALFLSYFWSYFGEGADSFEIVSMQTLVIFLVIDAIYTLSTWQMWGTSFGKSVMSLQIESTAHSHRPSLLALAQRYIAQSLMRYSVVGYPFAALLTALLTSYDREDGGPATFRERFRHSLQYPWYDALPTIKCRVAHHVVITARLIKNLETSHVPEDRQRFGMVKPFTIAENLILNDYYEAPYARQPSPLRLPLLTAAYTVVFAAVFASLGYLWLYVWNGWLWNDLLDRYGVPAAGSIRAIPTEVGMSALQRNYLNDPLLVSLGTLLVMVLLVGVASYLISNLLLRLIAKPHQIGPPIATVFAGFVLTNIVVSALDRILPALHDGLMLLSFAVISPGLQALDTDFNGAINKSLLALLALAVLFISGLIYAWLMERLEQQPNFRQLQQRLRTSRVGQFIEAYNDQGLVLNIHDTLGYSNELIKQYDIRTPSALNTGASLSGGNQQKLVVAREFSRQPRLLIASQPTRGIDVGSIEFIHKQIVAQRDQGTAVLLVSAELDEIMSLSDRIAVMYKGSIIKVVDAKSATREELGLLMAGIAPEESHEKRIQVDA